ncbi:hypothetical protein BFP70_11005 [Thioclava sp. SK-1]|uniref:hypothetical protein n=1 Tax=Thioclava sp. SK-1 TaxID=1889770 RepID=UPI0008260E47|nr:hypothetical protein [Thioclava sp. SK-1]OCX64556.1 hypothetical protein BFP70_11005 [Thioclava sp. SK-1]
MTMIKPHQDEDDIFLEPYFGAGRRQQPEPDTAFLGRILADAEANLMSGCRTVAQRPAAKIDLRQLFASIFGGWLPVGGMVSAGLAGVWIGFLGDVTMQSYLGAAPATASTVHLMPDSLSLGFAEE